MSILLVNELVKSVVVTLRCGSVTLAKKYGGFCPREASYKEQKDEYMQRKCSDRTKKVRNMVVVWKNIHTFAPAKHRKDSLWQTKKHGWKSLR